MQGICADRSYIAQNLYDDVAAQGCNVFLAPSAGAGNTTVIRTIIAGVWVAFFQECQHDRVDRTGSPCTREWTGIRVPLNTERALSSDLRWAEVLGRQGGELHVLERAAAAVRRAAQLHLERGGKALHRRREHPCRPLCVLCLLCSSVSCGLWPFGSIKGRAYFS